MIYDDASRARSTTYRWSIKCHATAVLNVQLLSISK